MRRTLARRATATFLSISLFPGLLGLAQQPSGEDSRPRRARPVVVDSPSKQTQEWQTPESVSVTGSESNQPSTNPAEPLIRVALATNTRSGTISTNGTLVNASGESANLVALDASRVRVESRLLSPSAISLERVEIRIANVGEREAAEQKAVELRNLTGEEPQLRHDAETNLWEIVIDSTAPREEAEELVERLINAGFDASILSAKRALSAVSAPVKESPTNKVRLTGRGSFPSREVVALASGPTPLLTSSAPVTFASADEQKTPVKFNDRPYRGRLEVFANTRGTLTVVNVLGIEDYVRGVVANELSPGSYPALHALKAQAIAARTYALRNRGQFQAQGFDLLPTTRSQVYRGLTSEHPLSTRAVDETRGLVATFAGEPINALYTSTCGGRTENSELIFNSALPYLRSRECAAEGQAALAPFTVSTTRELFDLQDEKNLPVARVLGLLTTHNLIATRAKITDSWVNDESHASEVRSWVAGVAQLARLTPPAPADEINFPGPFATALMSAVFGDSRADTLLNNADIDYYLAVRDAAEIPRPNRADLAALIRDGHLSIYPDATLRAREPIRRGRALQAIARLLEARGLLQLQKGTTRPSVNRNLILRTAKGKELPIKVNANAFLYRQLGDALHPVRSIVLVGGEPVTYHLNSEGEVDYLEVRPATNGASAERFSPFTNWSTHLSLGQIQARLGKAARNIGPIKDLRIAARGASRRVVDLEIVGANGTAHVRGGRIRSALGLREQLFVIEKQQDDEGRVTGFVFAGRGWGHGVGMCQVGAYGLAKQGFSYEQILKAYYTGVELTRLY